jgi:hypothetical protein
VYRVIVDEHAADQVDALPVAALGYFADAIGVLELVPHNGRPYNEDRPDGPMRELVIGDRGQGTITYLVLEQQREVHVLLVQWLG